MQALEKVNPASLERVQDEQVNYLALQRIKAEPRYHPLSSLVPEAVAATIEPWLVQYGKFHPATRVAIYAVVKFSTAEGNWVKTKQAMCIELGMQQADINYYQNKWPYMWLICNEICRWHSSNAVGRVLGSMTDAAIMGDSRDRRLYLEYFGHIKQEQRSEGGVTINFHNDVMNRPPAIDVEIVKEGSED
jgi:hypothetical protein